MFDVGDPIICCEFCGAKMWLAERVGKKGTENDAEFSLCCMKGKVHIPHLRRPPELLYSLLHGDHPKSKHYLDNIRAYNSMFSFTSMGGKIYRTVNDGGGPTNFVLSGQNYHRLGSLMPESDSTPKFAQLYIYDTQNESKNRLKHFRYNCF